MKTMKTFILSAVMLFLSIASFAGTKSTINKETTKELNSLKSKFALFVMSVRMTATYVSSCGVSWSCVSHGSSLAEAAAGMSSLCSACDAACGTSTSTIIM